MTTTVRIPFLLEYPVDDPDELRRHKPRENAKAVCRCGAKYSQYIVNPEYLASLRDGQRMLFLMTCERIKAAVVWPNQCPKCESALLGRRPK
jgi:hypothetical protein